MKHSPSRILRKTTKFIWAKKTLAHLESIRQFELEFSLPVFPNRGKVLEIGAGTGWQSKKLQELGFDVHAVDLDGSNYKGDRIFPVTDYDGHNIPFSDSTFDIVFSSNVMEHIPHISDFQAEIQRVLKPNGCVIHVVPSSAWRIWTSLSCFLRTWRIPEIHGEHANNLLAEVFVFRKIFWKQLFEETGWHIVEIRTCRIFYTGCQIMDRRMNISTRQKLSWLLGGATNLIVLKSKSK